MSIDSGLFLWKEKFWLLLGLDFSLNELEVAIFEVGI